jgi:hypothetical protein
VGGVATFSAGTAAAPSITTSGDTNNGIFFPATDVTAITTAGTERLRIDASGNLGLGVTPSAWGSIFNAMQLGDGGFIAGRSDVATQLQLGCNGYYDGSNFKYIVTGTAARYYMDTGAHYWESAASGTAGNAITFTQAMTLDASGNLSIGATSPPTNTTKLYTSDGTINTFISYKTGGVEYFGTYSNHPLAFLTNNTERARISSGGVLCLNTTGTNAGNLQVTQYTGKTMFRMETVDSGTSTAIQFVKTSGGAAEVGSITTTTTATAYNINSDVRLKKNIVNAQDSGSDIDALQVRSFDWKVDDSHVKYGFIAQELVTVAPESVKVGDSGDEIETVWGVDYSKLVPMLVKEIQSLRARVAALEAK